MKIFGDLGLGQAVCFNDVYIVCLGSGTYFIGDVEGIELGGSRLGSQHMVESLNIRKLIKPSRELTHYETKYGDQLSPENYTKSRSNVNSKYLDEEGYLCYPNLEVEYECKKKLSALDQYKPVYFQPDSYYEDVEISLIGTQQDTGSDFISTPYMLGQASFGGEGRIFRLDMSAAAYSEYFRVKESFRDSKFEEPNHSHMNYIKIDGDYVFTNCSQNYIGKENIHAYYPSLEKAIEAEHKVRKTIKGLMMIKLRDSALSDVTRFKVHNKLKSIRTSVYSIHAMKKSQSSKISSLQLINELIDYLVIDI